MTSQRTMILLLALALLGPSTGRAHAQSGTLDRLTEKLKKECEDRGGEFRLTSADTKTGAYDTSTDHRPSRETGSTAALGGGFDPGSKTTYQATGQCVMSLHTDPIVLPPSDAPRETLHLNPNG